MIGQYVEKNQRNWDEKPAALQFAFNTTVHDATEYLNCDRELTSPVRDHPNNEPAPELLQEQLKEAFELVKIHLVRAFQKQQYQYDLRRWNWRLKIGE